MKVLLGLSVLLIIAGCVVPERPEAYRFEFRFAEGETVLYRFDRTTGAAEVHAIAKDITLQIYKPVDKVPR